MLSRLTEARRVLLRSLWSCLALALLWPRAGVAATVAVLTTASRSQAIAETSFRLKGELLAVGLEVEVAARPAAEGPAWGDALEQLTLARHFDAVIDVLGDKTPLAIEIWTFEGPGQRFDVSRVVPDATSADPSTSLPIRAIEVVRSKLLERGLLAPTLADRRRSLPPSPEDPAPEYSRRRWLGVELGVGVLTGVDGLGPALLPLARVDWAMSSRFVAQATVGGFVGTRPTLRTNAGSADVGQSWAVLGLSHCWRCERTVQPFTSLSLGLLRTVVEGHTASPSQAHTVARSSFLMEGALGVSLRLSRTWSISLAAQGQLAEPYVAIHFEDAVVATSGRPNVAFSSTLGAWL